MPEVLEIEYYRRLAAGAVGRVISVVDAPDAWFLKGGLTAAGLSDALVGTTFVAAERRGKLLLLPTDRGPVLGLRFGMTGRLVLDGRAGIDRLAYASLREVAAWERLRVEFDDGGAGLVLIDARRLGAVVLDPPLEGLGPDVLAVRPAELAAALAGSRAPLKARLMDQARLAGLGNLLVDEILWRAGLDPARPAGGLTPAELRRLHRHLRATLAELIASGGSHLGGLMAARERGGRCPRDGAELERRTIGGRTTYPARGTSGSDRPGRSVCVTVFRDQRGKWSHKRRRPGAAAGVAGCQAGPATWPGCREPATGLCQTARAMPPRPSREVRARPATVGLAVAAVTVGVAAWLPLRPSAAAAAQQPADPAATTVAPGPVDPAATTVAPVPAPADPAATVATVAEPETERLDDPDARRTINLLIGILIGLALLVLIVTAWFWRATRPVAVVLEPLAAMSTRRFRRKSPDEQEGELHALHELKSATDPPPRAADLLRQVSGDDG